MGKAASREASGKSKRSFECNKREFAEESPIDQALSDGLQQCQHALMANPRMSRRAFFGGAAVAGALAFLGSVRTSGGLIVNAYADENGSASFSVYVLSREEIPVMALSDTYSPKQPAQGVEVTIRSLYNGKTVTVTTDKDGFAAANVRALSFECDDDNAATYTFYGCVEAAGKSMHYICYPSEFIQAGVSSGESGVRPNVLQIPVEYDTYVQDHRVVDSYLGAVTIDDIDVLHSSDPFYVGDTSDAEHKIYVEVRSNFDHLFPATEVALYLDGVEIERKAAERSWTTERTVWGKYTMAATFTGNYLKTIKPGQKLKVWFSVEEDRPKSVVLPVEFEQAQFVTDGGYDSFALTLGKDPDGNKEKRDLTPAIPILIRKYDSFYTSIPGFPIQFFADPAGNFGIVVKIAGLSIYKRVDGETVNPSQRFWFINGKTLRASKEAWKNDVHDYCMSRYRAAKNRGAQSDYGIGIAGLSRSLDVKFEFLLKAFGSIQKYEGEEKRYYLADAGAYATLGLQAEVGSQFSIIGIPFYIALDFSASVTASVALGIKFESGLQNFKWDTESGKFGPKIAVVFLVQAGLSLAVGIMGLFAAGLRGHADFKCELIFERKDNKPYPRCLLNASMGLEVFVQILFFRKSFQVVKPWEFLNSDNWNENNALQEVANPWQLVSSDEIGAEDMFTQEDLAVVSEYEAKPNASDDASLLTLSAEAYDGLRVGSPYTYTSTRDGHDAMARTAKPGIVNPYASLSGYQPANDYSADLLQAASEPYNPRLGLVPSEQRKLLGDVFSNTRLRTFVGNTAFNEEPEQNTIMARLVSAYVPASDVSGTGQQCTRVALRKWNALTLKFDAEVVIDFSVDGVAGYERMDVDFSLDYVVRNNNLYIALGVTSVRLPVGETCDYNDAENRQFVTFAMYNATAGVVEWSTSKYAFMRDFSTATFHPSVHFQGAEGDPDNMRACFYYYHKHFKDMTREDLTGIYLTSFKLDGTCLREDSRVFDGSNGSRTFVSAEALVKGFFEVSTAQNTSPDSLYETHTVIAWQGSDGVALSSGDSGQASDDEASASLKVLFGLIYENGTSVQLGYKQAMENIASFARRGNHMTDDMFVFTKHTDRPAEKRNHVIRFENSGSTMSEKETDCFSIDPACISSSNGRRLYTVRVNDGSSPALSDEVLSVIEEGGKLFSTSHYNEETGANFGGYSTTDAQAEPIYQLLESRWIDSLKAYHEFYPIARLNFAPDTVSVLTCSGGERDFVMTNVTDLEAGKSDVYQVSVPDVIAVQVEGVSSEIPYSAEGDKVPFVVTLSNIGNCLITGFTVVVTDSAGNEVMNLECPDLRDYLMESKDNYHTVVDADGNPSYNEDGTMKKEFVEDARDTSGVLWPGFTRNYRFNFRMPAGYEGQTTFNVDIKDARSNPYANTASADEVYAAVQASLGAAGDAGAGSGAGDGAATLMAEAEHLSWLAVDEFAESLFGANVLTIEDPRTYPISIEATDGQLASGEFTAVPATYVVEDDGSGDGGSGGGAGAAGSGGAGAAGLAAKTAPSTGDGVAGAVVAAAGVAAAAAGVAIAAKTHGVADEACAEGEE